MAVAVPPGQQMIRVNKCMKLQSTDIFELDLFDLLKSTRTVRRKRNLISI